MKVHEDKFQMITEVTYYLRNNADNRAFEIHNGASWRSNRIDLQINWSAIGSVPASKGIEFAENLRKTCEMIEAINALNLEITRSDEPYYTTREEMMDEKYKVLDMVQNFKTGQLIAWLITETH